MVVTTQAVIGVDTDIGSTGRVSCDSGRMTRYRLFMVDMSKVTVDVLDS